MNDEGRLPDGPRDITCAERTTPRLLIEIAVEERPRFREVVTTEQDRDRLIFWIKSSPAISELFESALALAAKEPAA